jgi:hypothetical protein
MSPDTRSAVLRVGIAGGILSFLTGFIPNSRAFPMIWPFVTGAVAFWIATSDGAVHHVRRGMSAALKAGSIAALVSFIGVTVTLFVIQRSVFDDVTRSAGLPGMAAIGVVAEIGIAVTCIVGIVAALLGAVVTIPVRSMRTPRSDAPVP